MAIIQNRTKEDKTLPTLFTNPLTSAESISAEGASICSQHRLFTTESLKASISFRKLVEMDGLKPEKSGYNYKCSCPFHQDRTPSFCIFAGDEFAKCFGCGWSGDIISYYQERTGCSFIEALDALASGVSLQGSRSKDTLASSSGQKPEYQFTDDDLAEVNSSTSRLLKEEWLCEKIAHWRGWKPATIHALATSRHLGWGGDCLNFIYPTGIKTRSWTEKRCTWWCGCGSSLWRADKLAEATEVYITEGEIDAITLIDAGLENRPNTAVVSVASASTIPSSKYIEMLRGKVITLCLDADDPGRACVNRIAPLLIPVAARVFNFDVKEVK